MSCLSLLQIYAVSITIRIVVSFRYSFVFPCIFLNTAYVMYRLFLNNLISPVISLDPSPVGIHAIGSHMEVWLPALHGADHRHPQWWLVVVPRVVRLSTIQGFPIINQSEGWYMMIQSFWNVQVQLWQYLKIGLNLPPSQTVGSCQRYLLLELFLEAT